MLEDWNPHKLPYGTEAILLHLRTVGAQSFVHIEMHTKKLKDNAREGKLWGYSSDSKVYRVYNPATREAIKSRTVVFIETLHTYYRRPRAMTT